MAKKDLNESDLVIGNLYCCSLRKLIIPDEFIINEIDEQAVNILLEAEFNFSAHLITILKYMGNGLFCEYYTQKYILGITNTANLRFCFQKDILCMVGLGNVRKITDNSILDDVYKQEKYSKSIQKVLNSLFDLKQNRAMERINKDWNNAILENNARIRLRKLEKIPVLE